jgi:hypothetical protein
MNYEHSSKLRLHITLIKAGYFSAAKKQFTPLLKNTENYIASISVSIHDYQIEEEKNLIC